MSDCTDKHFSPVLHSTFFDASCYMSVGNWMCAHSRSWWLSSVNNLKSLFFHNLTCVDLWVLTCHKTSIKITFVHERGLWHLTPRRLIDPNHPVASSAENAKYIICKDQYKMKIWDLLFKKSKPCPSKYHNIFFFSFMVPLSKYAMVVFIYHLIK